MTEWRKCTSCKGTIAFQTPYWICNVSTCQKKRAGLVFCSMECWDAHLPVLRHKEAWAVELTSPSSSEWAEVLKGDRPDRTYPERERTPEPEAPVSAPKAPSSGAPAPVIRRRRQE